jgi:ribosomal protein L40E
MHTYNRAPFPKQKRAPVRAVVGLLTGLTLALLLAAGCGHQETPMTPTHPQTTADVTPSASRPAQYVGSGACKGCHPNAFAQHAAGRHARTLTPVGKEGLPELNPPIGRIAGTHYAIFRRGDQLAFGFADQPDTAETLHMTMGSGKTGVAYLSVTQDFLRVAQMSYFPQEKAWHLSPGQEKAGTDLGTVSWGEKARACMKCHVTTLTADPRTPPEQQPLLPERRFFGVGCESCHGPGSRHVEVTQRGEKKQHFMEDLGTWSATRLNTLCGECHNTPGTGNSMSKKSDETHRYQTFGLMKSACFQQSGDRLSCLTCHAPHTDVATDAKQYDSICMRCHATAPNTPPPSPIFAAKRICPVNARANCVSCHMPDRPVFTGSKSIQTRMADHYIRTPRPKP